MAVIVEEESTAVDHVRVRVDVCHCAEVVILPVGLEVEVTRVVHPL